MSPVLESVDGWARWRKYGQFPAGSYELCSFSEDAIVLDFPEDLPDWAISGIHVDDVSRPADTAPWTEVCLSDEDVPRVLGLLWPDIVRQLKEEALPRSLAANGVSAYCADPKGRAGLDFNRPTLLGPAAVLGSRWGEEA